MFTAADMQILAASKRLLAERARRWADQLATLTDQALLLQYADNLECDALELEQPGAQRLK